MACKYTILSRCSCFIPLFFSVITYGCEVWDLQSENNSKNLHHSFFVKLFKEYENPLVMLLLMSFGSFPVVYKMQLRLRFVSDNILTNTLRSC